MDVDVEEELAKFLELLRRHAVVGVRLSADEVIESQRLAECLLAHLEHKWQAILASHPDAPALATYMSDGWSTFTRQITHRQLEGVNVRRAGKTKKEFLLQRSLLSVLQRGGPEVRTMMFKEPLPMRNGKTAWNCFQAMCDFGPTLRASGHLGLALSAYLFDGALCSALSRHIHARHSVFYKLEVELGDLREVLESKDWVFVLKCIAHSASNSVKWGLSRVLRRIFDEKDFFVSIEALKNSRSDIHDKIGSFTASRVVFTHERTGTLSDREQLWRALGVVPTMIDTFAFMDPVYTNNVLRVNAALELEEGSRRKVGAAQLHCCTWTSMSLTRWGKVRDSAMRMVRSCLMGLEGLIDLVKQDDSISLYHLNGFDKASREVRTFYAVASISPVSAEAFVLELLQDDRFLKRADELWELIEEEFRFVLSLSAYYWDRVASFVAPDMTGRELRVTSIRCCITTCGYLHWDSFQVIRRYPWSLTQGDIGANLIALEAAPIEDIREPTTRRIKRSLRLGVSLGEACSALEHIRDTLSCTTTLVEEGHGTGACLMKEHEQYIESTLCSRAVIHQGRALFAVHRGRQFQERIEAKIQALEACTPKVGGRHMFVRMLAKQGGSVAGLGARSQQLCRDRMVRVSGGFGNLLPRDRLALDFARQENYRRSSIASDDVAHLRALLQLHRARSRAELDSVGRVNHVSSFRFTDLETSELMDRYNRHVQTVPKNALRRLAVESPDVPPAAHQALFIAEARALGLAERIQQPWWVRHVAANRVAFEDCAIVDRLDLDVAYYVSVAIQRPYAVSFLRMRRLPNVLPAYGSPEVEARQLPLHHRKYSYLPLDFVVGDLVQIEADSANLNVLFGIGFEDDVAFTNHASVDFEAFTAHHVACVPQGAAAVDVPVTRGIPRSEKDKLLATYPWLSEEDLKDVTPGSGGGRFGRSYGKRDRPVGEGSEDDVDEASEVDDFGGEAWDDADIDAELGDLRREYDDRERVDDPEEFFYRRILGGKFCARNRGVVANSICGFPRAGLPLDWCKTYEFPLQMACHFRQYHGQENCEMLTREYCRRGSFFFRLWLEAGASHDFEYDEFQKDSYEEDETWILPPFIFSPFSPVSNITIEQIAF